MAVEISASLGHVRTPREQRFRFARLSAWVGSGCQQLIMARAPASKLMSESHRTWGRPMVSARWLLFLLAVSVAGTGVHAQEINWQEAVARLAHERTLAETCVALLRKYGDAAAQDRGSLAYGQAKGEYRWRHRRSRCRTRAQRRAREPALICKARLQYGFDEREAFCISVLPLVPQSSGERGPIADSGERIVKPVMTRWWRSGPGFGMTTR